MKAKPPVLLLPLALLAAASPPAWGASADGAIWTATHVRDVGYLPLENLRGFYKLIPKPASPGSLCAVGNPGFSISFGPGKRDVSIGGYRCRLVHPVERDAAGGLMISKADMVKLFDPILRPTYIPDRREVRAVVLDPGHGGHDAGAQTPYAREADVTLLAARRLKEELEKRGYLVTLTRDQNQYLSDQQRIACANQAASAIFISLHLNSGRSDIQGVETYCMAPQGPHEAPRPGNVCDAANIALAYALHAALVSGSGASDGACRRARYSLLSSVNCPAALVELGYATHKDEGAALSTEEYCGKLAVAMADGIDAFARAIAPGASLKPAAAPEAPPAAYAAEPPAGEGAAKPARASGGDARQTPRADSSRRRNGRRRR